MKPQIYCPFFVGHLMGKSRHHDFSHDWLWVALLGSCVIICGIYNASIATKPVIIDISENSIKVFRKNKSRTFAKESISEFGRRGSMNCLFVKSSKGYLEFGSNTELSNTDKEWLLEFLNEWKSI
jgi:hypothetical protein